MNSVEYIAAGDNLQHRRQQIADGIPVRCSGIHLTHLVLQHVHQRNEVDSTDRHLLNLHRFWFFSKRTKVFSHCYFPLNFFDLPRGDSRSAPLGPRNMGEKNLDMYVFDSDRAKVVICHFLEQLQRVESIFYEDIKVLVHVPRHASEPVADVLAVLELT